MSKRIKLGYITKEHDESVSKTLGYYAIPSGPVKLGTYAEAVAVLKESPMRGFSIYKIVAIPVSPNQPKFVVDMDDCDTVKNTLKLTSVQVLEALELFQNLGYSMRKE